MTSLSPDQIAYRIGLAVLIGLILGFERERHGRAAGMRTTMLVCTASAVAMILSEYLFTASTTSSSAWRPDPARLAQGVLAGMGFLGAGVILKQDKAILGVTTAAVLWFGAILGMAAGSGYTELALGGFLMALLALYILPYIESRVPSDRYVELSVTAELKGAGPDDILDRVRALGLVGHIHPLSLEEDKKTKEKKMTFEVKVKKPRLGRSQVECVAAAATARGVKKVSWI